jgi:hypothetical protein
MHSQKNEAMNRSIMRYCPKEKTYSRTMTLTSRINLAISIDTLGHAKYYEDLFAAMEFNNTQLTFSGLRRMWRKKEYGRIYSGLRRVKVRRRIKQRERMVEGTDKLVLDAKEGRGYSSGIRLRETDEDEEGEGSTTIRAKKAKMSRLTRKVKDECRCGGKDHQRTSSSKCPWKNLGQKAVCEKYEQRMKEMQSRKSNPTTNLPGVPTEGYENQVQFNRSSNRTTDSPGIPTEENENNVHSTSKYLARGFKKPLRQQNTCISPGTLSTWLWTGRNPDAIAPLPSVDDIAAIAENDSDENAILIARTEIDCLDDLSLEGDIPDDVSDSD